MRGAGGGGDQVWHCAPAGEYGRRIDNSPGYIRAACEASLQRLRVERIGLYYCHRRDPAVPIEDVVGAMAELVQAGKVAQIGFV